MSTVESAGRTVQMNLHCDDNYWRKLQQLQRRVAQTERWPDAVARLEKLATKIEGVRRASQRVTGRPGGEIQQEAARRYLRQVIQRVQGDRQSKRPPTPDPDPESTKLVAFWLSTHSQAPEDRRLSSVIFMLPALTHARERSLCSRDAQGVETCGDPRQFQQNMLRQVSEMHRNGQTPASFNGSVLMEAAQQQVAAVDNAPLVTLPIDPETERLKHQAQCRTEQADHTAAVRAASQALARMEAMIGSNDARLHEPLAALARYEVAADDHAAALAHLDRAVALIQAAPETQRNLLIGWLKQLYDQRIDVLIALGDKAGARESMRLRDQTRDARAERMQAASARYLAAVGMPNPFDGQGLVDSQRALRLDPPEESIARLAALASISGLDLTNEAILRASINDHEGAIKALTLASDVTERDIVSFAKTGLDENLLTPTLDGLARQEALALTLAINQPSNTAAAALAWWLVSNRRERAFQVFETIASDDHARNPTLLANIRQARSRVANEYLKQLGVVTQPTGSCAQRGAPTPSSTTKAAREALEKLELQLLPVADMRQQAFNPTPPMITARPRTTLSATPWIEYETALRNALGPTHALVELVAYTPIDSAQAFSRSNGLMPARYAALVVRGNDPVRVIDLGAADTIDAAANTLRSKAANPNASVASVKSAGQAAYAQWVAPWLAAVEGAAHVFVVSDASLQAVPLEVTHNGTTWLDELMSVSYLNTARDLLQTSAPSTAPNPSVLVFAEPQAPRNDYRYPELAARNFGPLPGTAQEADAITRHFPSAVVIRAREANERALLSTVSPRVLHIASHGFALDADRPGATPRARSVGFVPRETRAVASAPNQDRQTASERWLRSALVLSAPTENGTEDLSDSYATAFEIARMSLQGTELVVLSACQTGVGTRSAHQGVHSLRRAFMMAGARSVIASLWLVADDATADAMNVFYAALARGDDRAAALRAAKQSIRAVHPHPFYWAPLTLTGSLGAL